MTEKQMQSARVDHLVSELQQKLWEGWGLVATEEQVGRIVREHLDSMGLVLVESQD